MKNIQMFAPPCKRSQKVEEMVGTSANALGLDVTVEKITNYVVMAKYDIASTPAIVINGKVVYSGGLSKEDVLNRWLQA